MSIIVSSLFNLVRILRLLLKGLKVLIICVLVFHLPFRHISITGFTKYFSPYFLVGSIAGFSTAKSGLKRILRFYKIILQQWVNILFHTIILLL